MADEGEPPMDDKKVTSQDGGSPPMVFYGHDLQRFTSPACAERVLGIVGYGTGQSAIPRPTPFVAAPLQPAARAGDAFEVWTASTPTACVQVGPVAGACSEALAFGALMVPES